MTSDSSTLLRVLFVEDAFDHALLVKAFLSGAGGYEVTHSQDGDHAVMLLQDQEWDLIISDLNLPGTDGFEVIRVARGMDPDIPILATTGYTEQTYHDRATRAGDESGRHEDTHQTAGQGHIPRDRERPHGCGGRAEPIERHDPGRGRPRR